jgi:hypothetical protein
MKGNQRTKSRDIRNGSLLRRTLGHIGSYLADRRKLLLMVAANPEQKGSA